MSDLGADAAGADAAGGAAPTPLNSAFASAARLSSGGGADRPAGSPHEPAVLLSLISPLCVAAAAAMP